MSPVFSIVLCTYNAEAYLDECIRSLLNQTFKDFELIIVDDGSMDGTLRHLEAIQDARIRLVKLGSNHGLIYARTQGFSKAKGRYVAIMDADDIAHPERLQSQWEVFQNQNVDVCGSWHISLYSATGKLRARRSPVTNSDIKALLTVYCPISNPSASIKAEVLQRHHYNTAHQHAEDYGLWCGISADGGTFFNIPRPLLTYRIHPGQVSQQKRETALKSFQTIQANYIKSLLGISITPRAMSFGARMKEGLFFMRKINEKIPGISLRANYQLYAEFQHRGNGLLTPFIRLERLLVAAWMTLLGRRPGA